MRSLWEAICPHKGGSTNNSFVSWSNLRIPLLQNKITLNFLESLILCDIFYLLSFFLLFFSLNSTFFYEVFCPTNGEVAWNHVHTLWQKSKEIFHSYLTTAGKNLTAFLEHSPLGMLFGFTENLCSVVSSCFLSVFMFLTKIIMSSK